LSWLALITGLVKLANALADYAGRRQLITAGQAEAVATGCQATLSMIEKARRAENAIDHPSAADDGFAKRVHDEFGRPDA
jgi:hypothetical protein